MTARLMPVGSFDLVMSGGTDAAAYGVDSVVGSAKGIGLCSLTADLAPCQKSCCELSEALRIRAETADNDASVLDAAA
jgi:hypothetical protein